MSMAARIRQARKGADMTQEKLASVCGVSRAAVAQWESERESGTRPTTANLATIARATGRSMDWLTGESATELAEADAEWAAPPDGDRLVRALVGDQRQVFWLRAKTDALDRVGILPGDWLICRYDGELADGDLVVANVERENGVAETWVRVLRQGFLRPASSSDRHQIIVADDPRVGLLGRIVLRYGEVPRAPEPERQGRAA